MVVVLFMLVMVWFMYVFGWEYVFLWMGLFGIVFVVLWFVWYCELYGYWCVIDVECDYLCVYGVFVDLEVNCVCEWLCVLWYDVL